MIFLKKVNIGKNVSIYPMPVTLVGSKVEEKPNFMTVAWITRVNAAPSMLAVSLNKPRYTAKGIRENKTFSVNFPKVDMAEQTDYCGLASGRESDKSGLFEVFYGDLKTAPMIKSCPLSLECRLMNIIELPTNDLFIGEIVNGYADEQSFTEGELDVHKINPLLLTMPDNRYWSVGDYVGDAWSIGGRQGKLSEK
jgi:flavin reductase (DIM6/NTAB) family NADH-FMN oxidoreductase RutF